jgi:hypothetical protein
MLINSAFLLCSVIVCSKLPGIGLDGSLGYELSNLFSLKTLWELQLLWSIFFFLITALIHNFITCRDLSNNNLHGSIPYQLPPNLTHLYVFVSLLVYLFCSIWCFTVNGDAGIWVATISMATFHTLYQIWLRLNTCKLLTSATWPCYVLFAQYTVRSCWKSIIHWNFSCSNLSHNSLSQQLGDLFGSLNSLSEL